MSANFFFLLLLEQAGLPAPVREYRFCPSRRWRFDYAWIQHRVALEVDGGVWTHGRHTRATGFLKDIEKYNEAACLGWRLLRCTPNDLCGAELITCIHKVLCQGDKK